MEEIQSSQENQTDNKDIVNKESILKSENQNIELGWDGTFAIASTIEFNNALYTAYYDLTLINEPGSMKVTGSCEVKAQSIWTNNFNGTIEGYLPTPDSDNIELNIYWEETKSNTTLKIKFDDESKNSFSGTRVSSIDNVVGSYSGARKY